MARKTKKPTARRKKQVTPRTTRRPDMGDEAMEEARKRDGYADMTEEQKAQWDAAYAKRIMEQKEAEERAAEEREKTRARAKGELDDAARAALHRLHADFTRDIPQAGRGGAFQPGKEGPFADRAVDAPDGAYRVGGGDWIYTVRKGRFTGAARASETNRWGGPGVVSL